MKSSYELVKKLDHIAFIMDGNGRWANANGLIRTLGHKAAIDKLIPIVLECSRLNIKACSLYAFSTENWKRPKDEIDRLFEYLDLFFKKEINTLIKNDIKVRVSGEIERLPENTRITLDKSIEQTSNCNGMVLNICLSYGSREEILRACKSISRKVKEGSLSVDEITNVDFENELYTSNLPMVDLMIRTSGEKRLSNYLLYQNAYAEFIFTEVPWPEFSVKQLHLCLDEYQNRNRRYGGLKNE